MRLLEVLFLCAGNSREGGNGHGVTPHKKKPGLVMMAAIWSICHVPYSHNHPLWCFTGDASSMSSPIHKPTHMSFN